MDCLRCGLPVEDGEDAYRYRAFKGTGDVSQDKTELTAAEHTACLDANKTGQRLRIVADGTDFSSVYVRLVQPDGSEVPFQDIVRSVTIRVDDGAVNVATVVFEGVEFYADAYLDSKSEPITVPGGK